MSIRALNSNASKAVALAESGEVIEITRNGKSIYQADTRRRSAY
jgi:antitoxin (DNA-binding transcriptional repressor) of toxin-antitoxin stability system